MFKVGFIGDKTKSFSKYSELLSSFSSAKYLELPDSSVSELSYKVLKVGEGKELKVRSYPVPLGKQRHHGKLHSSDDRLAESIESELMLEELGSELVLEEEEEICEIMVYYKYRLEKNEIKLLELLEEVFLEELERPIPKTVDGLESQRIPNIDLELDQLDEGEEEGEDEDEFVEMNLKKLRLPFLVVLYHKKSTESVKDNEVFTLVDFDSYNGIPEEEIKSYDEEGEECEGEEEEEEEKSTQPQRKRKMYFYHLSENYQDDFRKIFFKVVPDLVFAEPIKSILKEERESCMTVEIFKEEIILIIRKYLAQLYILDKFNGIISRIGEMCHYYHGKMMNDNPRIEEVIQQLLKNMKSTKIRFFNMFKEEVTSSLTASDEELVKIRWKELVQSLNTLIYQVRRFESDYFITETKDLPKLNWDPNNPLKLPRKPNKEQQNDKLVLDHILLSDRSNQIFKIKRKRRDRLLRFLLRIIHYIEIYGSDSKGLFGKSVDISNIRRTYFMDFSAVSVVPASQKKSHGFSQDLSMLEEGEEGVPKKMHLNLKSIVMPAVCSIFQAFVRKYFCDLSSNPFLLDLNQQKIVRIMKKTKTLLRQKDETVERRKLDTKIFWFQKFIFEAFSTFEGFREEEQSISRGRRASQPSQRVAGGKSLSDSSFTSSPSLSSSCFQNFLFFKTFFEFLYHMTEHIDKNLLNPSLLSVLFCPSFFGMKNSTEEKLFMQSENYLFFTKFFEINLMYSKAIWNYELFVEGKKLYSSTSTFQEDDDDKSMDEKKKRKRKRKDNNEGSSENNALRRLKEESKIREKFKYHGKIQQHCQNEFTQKKSELKQLKKESEQVIQSIELTLHQQEKRINTNYILEEEVEGEDDDDSETVKNQKKMVEIPVRKKGSCVEGFFFKESDLTKIPREWKKMQEKNQENLERGEKLLRSLEEFYSFLEHPYMESTNDDYLDVNDNTDDEKRKEKKKKKKAEEEADNKNEKKNKNKMRMMMKMKRKSEFPPKRYSRTVGAVSFDGVDGEKTMRSEQNEQPSSLTAFSELCLFLDWMKREKSSFDEELEVFSKAKIHLDHSVEKVFFEEEFLESEECREYCSISNYIRIKETEIFDLKKKARQVSTLKEDNIKPEDLLDGMNAIREEKDIKKSQDIMSTLRKRSVDLLHEIIGYKKKLHELEERVKKLYFPECKKDVEKCFKRLRKKGLRTPEKEEESTATEKSKMLLEEKEIQLRCPLTKKSIENPVILAETGEVFERVEIERHLRDSNFHPISGKELKSRILIPDFRIIKKKKTNKVE